jgi:hypothetical protein
MVRLSLSSLRARLLLLVLLAVLPGFGLALCTAWDHGQQGTDAVKRNARQLAEIVSAEHERLIESAHQLLTALARPPEVRRHDVRAVIGRVLARQPV